MKKIILGLFMTVGIFSFAMANKSTIKIDKLIFETNSGDCFATTITNHIDNETHMVLYTSQTPPVSVDCNGQKAGSTFYTVNIVIEKKRITPPPSFPMV